MHPSSSSMHKLSDEASTTLREASLPSALRPRSRSFVETSLQRRPSVNSLSQAMDYTPSPSPPRPLRWIPYDSIPLPPFHRSNPTPHHPLPDALHPPSSSHSHMLDGVHQNQPQPQQDFRTLRRHHTAPAASSLGDLPVTGNNPSQFLVYADNQQHPAGTGHSPFAQSSIPRHPPQYELHDTSVVPPPCTTIATTTSHTASLPSNFNLVPPFPQFQQRHGAFSTSEGLQDSVMKSFCHGATSTPLERDGREHRARDSDAALTALRGEIEQEQRSNMRREGVPFASHSTRHVPDNHSEASNHHFGLHHNHQIHPTPNRAPFHWLNNTCDNVDNYNPLPRPNNNSRHPSVPSPAIPASNAIAVSLIGATPALTIQNKGFRSERYDVERYETSNSPSVGLQGQPTQSAIGHQDFHPNSTFHLRKDPKQQQLDEKCHGLTKLCLKDCSFNPGRQAQNFGTATLLLNPEKTLEKRDPDAKSSRPSKLLTAVSGGASSCLSRGLHGAEGQTSEEVAVVGSRINGRNPNFTMDRQERPSENLHLHLQVSGSKGASAFVRRSSMFSSASTTSPSYLSASPSTSTPPSSASVTDSPSTNSISSFSMHNGMPPSHPSPSSSMLSSSSVMVTPPLAGGGSNSSYFALHDHQDSPLHHQSQQLQDHLQQQRQRRVSYPFLAGEGIVTTTSNNAMMGISFEGEPPHDAPMGVSMGVDSMAAPPAYPHPMDPNSLPPHPQNLRPSFHQYNHSSTPAASTSSPQVSSGPTRRLSFTSAAAAAATSPHHRSNHAPPPLYRRRRVQSLQSLSISNPSARPSASTMSAMHQPHIHSTSMPTYPSSAMPNIMSPYPVSPSIQTIMNGFNDIAVSSPISTSPYTTNYLPTSSSLHYSSTPSTESSFLFLPSTPVFDVSPHPFAQPSPYPSQTHPPTIVPSTPTDPMFPHQEPAWPAFTGLTYDDHEALGGMVGVDRSVRSLSPSSPPRYTRRYDDSHHYQNMNDNPPYHDPRETLHTANFTIHEPISTHRPFNPIDHHTHPPDPSFTTPPSVTSLPAPSTTSSDSDSPPPQPPPLTAQSAIKHITPKGLTFYECPFPTCSRMFRRRYNLSSHLFCHTGERSQVCHVCGWGFARRHDLKRHVKTLHNDERPFSCTVCNQRFLKEEMLARHRNVCDGGSSSGFHDQVKGEE